MKKFFSLFLSILMILNLFSGCGKDSVTADTADNHDGVAVPDQAPDEKESNTFDVESEKLPFRILIDKNFSYNDHIQDRAGFSRQFSKRLKDFKAAHPELDITVDEIPTNGLERDAFVQNIKTELLVGNGPDVILLQNDFSYQDMREFSMSAFLDDVSFAMKNGLLYDISDQYDNDAELTAGLNSKIMDAGVYGGARYVLPMRYDIPVVYVDRDAFNAAGLDRSMFDSAESFFRGAALSENVKNMNSFSIAKLHRCIFNLLPKLFDYENGKTAASVEDMARLISSYRDYSARMQDCQFTYEIDRGNGTGSSYTYIEFFYSSFCLSGAAYKGKPTHWSEVDRVMFVDVLSTLIENLVLAGMSGTDVEIYPLRAVDGSVVADVTLYGAVTAGSRDPDAAYEFLREFLTEEYQWERNLSNESYTWQVSAPGWPVRTVGSVSGIIESLKASKNMTESYLSGALDFGNYTDADAPILNINIDEVRFTPSNLENTFYQALSNAVNSEIDEYYGNIPLDIEQFSKTWIDNLQHHLDEG